MADHYSKADLFILQFNQLYKYGNELRKLDVFIIMLSYISDSSDKKLAISL